MSHVAIPFPSDRIPIMIWPDPVTDAVGHDPRAPYVERFWLPILGPSTVWLLRYLVDELDKNPKGLDLCLNEASRALGLARQPLSRHSAFAGALSRTVQFGAAQYFGGGLAVRRRLPYLPARHVTRLTERLQTEHGEWIEREESTSADGLRRRAFSLALTLLRLDDDHAAVRWQLAQWRFTPSMIDEAMAWAANRIDPEREGKPISA